MSRHFGRAAASRILPPADHRYPACTACLVPEHTLALRPRGWLAECQHADTAAGSTRRNSGVTEARCPVLNLLLDAKVRLRMEWLRDNGGTVQPVRRS
ncbi:MAG TPA: hypothetical protein VF834_15150 [Streptosporangiaceae bacterium]